MLGLGPWEACRRHDVLLSCVWRSIAVDLKSPSPYTIIGVSSTGSAGALHPAFSVPAFGLASPLLRGSPASGGQPFGWCGGRLTGLRREVSSVACPSVGMLPLVRGREGARSALRDGRRLGPPKPGVSAPRIWHGYISGSLRQVDAPQNTAGKLEKCTCEKGC